MQAIQIEIHGWPRSLVLDAYDVEATPFAVFENDGVWLVFHKPAGLPLSMRFTSADLAMWAVRRWWASLLPSQQQQLTKRGGGLPWPMRVPRVDFALLRSAADAGRNATVFQLKAR